jgi:hypothetical protein
MVAKRSAPKRRFSYLVRIEAPPPRWRVQLMRRRRVYTKDFTDSAHGGRRAALAKALAIRDRLLRSVPVRSAIKSHSSRSKTGIVGVYLVKDRGSRRRYYCATWSKGGRRFNLKFSVSEYGEARARALAVEARRRAVAEILAWRGRSPLKPVKRSNVGVRGVHYGESRTAAGNVFRFYNATWLDASGRDHQRTFSIHKYGKARALELALAARRKGVRDARR